jgi:hypothetical protein
MPPRPELLNGDKEGEEGAVPLRNSNYGAIQQGDHDTEGIRVPLTRMSLSDDSFEHKCKNQNKTLFSFPVEMKRISKLLAAIIFVGTILSGVFYISMSKKKADESMHNHHHQNAGHHFDNGETKMNPFFLHPVRDLGMLSVDRSQSDASPSSIWSQSGEDWQPLPTNSWYLVSQNYRKKETNYTAE